MESPSRSTIVLYRAMVSILWFQLKGKPFQNEQGTIEKIVGTVQDITEQKRNQERLEKGKELLKEAQSMAHMGSFDWNISQNVLRCSEEFSQILQIGQEDIWLTFDNYLERIHPLDRELTRKKIFDAISSRKPMTSNIVCFYQTVR